MSGQHFIDNLLDLLARGRLDNGSGVDQTVCACLGSYAVTGLDCKNANTRINGLGGPPEIGELRPNQVRLGDNDDAGPWKVSVGPAAGQIRRIEILTPLSRMLDSGE